MPKPVLYSFDISPPVLAVQSTAAAIGLELDIKNIDLTKRENWQDWYLKLNPQHTVPTLNDNGVVLWDSHAICTYILEKYAPDNTLYPKDLARRAQIDQRLYFDSGVLFAAVRLAQFPVFAKGAYQINPSVIDALFSAFDFLETFLESGDYLVGNSVTLADLCCVASVWSAQAILTIEPAKYPRLLAWIGRLFVLPYVSEINKESATGWRQLIELNKQKACCNQ